MSRGVGILRGGYIWGGLELVCPGVGMSRKLGISGGGYVLQWVGVGMSRGGYVLGKYVQGWVYPEGWVCLGWVGVHPPPPPLDMGPQEGEYPPTPLPLSPKTGTWDTTRYGRQVSSTHPT